MPTFSTKPSGGLMGSIKNAIAGMSGPNPLQLIQLESMGAETAQHSALAEKARMEVEDMRRASAARANPMNQAQAAGDAAGMTTADSSRLMNHLRGVLEQPSEFDSRDAEMAGGTAQPYLTSAPAIQPGQRDRFQNTLAAMQFSNMGTGKSTADDIAKAAGSVQGQGITDRVQQAIARGDYMGASAANQGGKLGNEIELYKPLGSTGGTLAPATGTVNTDNPLAKSTIEKNKRDNNAVQVLRESIIAAGGDPDSPTGKSLFAELNKKLTTNPSTTVHNPPPVTPVTIADPQDPTGMATVVIDGRTQQVLGKGPKLTQTGAVDQKLATQMPQAKSRVAAITQNMDRLDAAMQELHDDPGLTRVTGTLMGRTPNLTNTATGAQAKLNSVKSQIFQESLQAMREASKTGGAVGNVSDREGDKLERTLAALDQSQGTPDFKAQLKKAQAQVRLSKQIIQQAYEDQFSGVQSSPTGTERRTAPRDPAKRVVVDF